MSLLKVKDIGPKTVDLLLKKEIKSVEDLISFYPTTYSTYNYNTLAGRFYLHCFIASKIKTFKTKQGLFVTKFHVDFGSESYEVFAFNQKYLFHSYNMNDAVTVYGEYDNEKKIIKLHKIAMGHVNKDIFPIYPTIKGLGDKKINKIILNSIQVHDIDETVKKHLTQLHSPNDLDELSDALYFLKYLEFEAEYLKIIEQRKKHNSYDSVYMKNLDRRFKENITSMLEYKLTQDQERIVDEVLSNAILDQKTNSLVIGDVGSGKTIIALIVSYVYVMCGYQVVYLVPTTMLACQIHTEMSKYLGEKVAILTSETKKRELNSLKKNLADMTTMMVIGTHAVLNNEVNFSNLGLAIIDEQHRFGVKQRAKLTEKGTNVDLLALTATPIPRTLSKALYGAVSVQRIETKHYKGVTKTILTNDFSDIDFYVNKYSDSKIFVIVPLISSIEDSGLYDLKMVEKHICSHSVNKKVCVISSKSKNKSEIMTKLNEYDIIIATSVVEVGIDIPNARCIFILNAEKYGVAQLHQLRGRIGRNNDFNECVLHTTTTNIESLKRLNVVVNSSDGFELAKHDLHMRGGGTLFGNKQSGYNNFKLFDLTADLDIVQDVINNHGESL